MEPLIGSVLDGRFGVDAYLGGGSMADVYRGLDLERNEPVAIKVLRPAMMQSFELVERFRREADALARLSHPNIVRQHGAGRDGDYVYIAMQFIDGHPLAEEISGAGGPMPMGRVLDVADGVCAALSYAHAAGIVHRDIKPGNVLVDLATGRPVLTDFGIAKVADAASMTSFAIGTPAYMSPEQCRGQVVDGRSDIYAIGCVLYEMLAGVKPFRGERTRYDEGSSHAIVHEQMTRQAPPIRLYNPDLSPELERVVARAMAKAPAQRYTDANQLAADLRAAARARGLRNLRVVAPAQAVVRLDGVVAGQGAVVLTGVADGQHEIEVQAFGETFRTTVVLPRTEAVYANIVVPAPAAMPAPFPVAPAPHAGFEAPPAIAADLSAIETVVASQPDPYETQLAPAMTPIVPAPEPVVRTPAPPTTSPAPAAVPAPQLDPPTEAPPGAVPQAASGGRRPPGRWRRTWIWVGGGAAAGLLGVAAIGGGVFFYLHGGGKSAVAGGATSPAIATAESPTAMIAYGTATPWPTPPSPPHDTATPPSPPQAAAPPIGTKPVYAAIVARVAPDTCANERSAPSRDANIIQCIAEGAPVTITGAPQDTADPQYGRWWPIQAGDGRSGWMAEAFLLLATQTLPVDLHDANSVATLFLDAVDIQPGGDIVLQLAFENNTSAPVTWQSDVGNTNIYLTDDFGRRMDSLEVGGSFTRAVPGGLAPRTRLYGWHRFRLPDLTYRGNLTLHYPNHNDITFAFNP